MFSKFQCWRCDKVTSEGKKCSTCGMAYYCTDRCRMNDEFRHNSSECQDVAVRYVCHGCHKKTTTKMKMCTNCMKVWFCSDDCKKKAWEKHKIECKAVSRETIELGSKLNKIKALKMTHPGMLVPYYWGNSPALDLLNLCMNEGLHYTEPLSLLLCGVGDPRNVCFTISKLQDAEYQGKVTFVMNDICSCTLARTVLLLYLLCKGGVSKAGSVTQIWYSLYLSEEDHQFVVSGLRDLIQISNLEVITHGVMKMNADHFNRLKKVWRKWMQLSEKKNDISRQRREVFQNNPKAGGGMIIYLNEIPERHRRSAEDWFDKGLLCGDAAAENDLIKENCTLLGSGFLCQNEGSYKYDIQTNCLPFVGWDYRIVRASYPDTDSLTEMYCNYITDVLRKCAARLQNDDIHLSFILSNCTDITPYLPEGMTYDRITMSNLWDYIHLRDLLSMAKPLLNTGNSFAVIVTETHNWVKQFELYSFPLHVKKFGILSLMPWSSLRRKVLQDTGNKAIAESESDGGFADYYSLIEEFMSFLRASLLNSPKHSVLTSTSLIPSVNQLAADLGLKPRDFICQENRVAPFRWRMNTRRVTLLRGSELSVEWLLL